MTIDFSVKKNMKQIWLNMKHLLILLAIILIVNLIIAGYSSIDRNENIDKDEIVAKALENEKDYVKNLKELYKDMYIKGDKLPNKETLTLYKLNINNYINLNTSYIEKYKEYKILLGTDLSSTEMYSEGDKYRFIKKNLSELNKNLQEILYIYSYFIEYDNGLYGTDGNLSNQALEYNNILDKNTKILGDLQSYLIKQSNNLK